MRYGKGLFPALLLACAVIGTSSGIPAAADTTTGRSAPIFDLLVGSWLVTYDVQAFGFPIPILLSFTRDGVMIETDTPAPTPVGNLGTLILSNGHGEWEPTNDGAQLTANLLIEFLDRNGNVLLTAPGSATGTKIRIEQP